MCLAVYLICSETLKEAPWSNSQHAFYIGLAEGEAIPKSMKEKLLYHLGTGPRGCSCRFRKSDIPSADLPSVQAEYNVLATVIDKAIDRGVTIELVACDGEFASAPREVTGEIQSTEIKRPEFELREGQRFRVVAPRKALVRRGR
jgi:hypothetical protein